MAEYVVTGPDGKEYEVTAPEGATEAQIIRQVQSYIDSTSMPEPTQEEPGFWGGLGNAVARFGGRVGTMYDNYMAEQLAQAADAEAEMQRRRESGEMSTLDRILTARAPDRMPGGANYESPEDLRSQAAGYIASGAQRTQDFAERFPMTRAGGQAISDLSQAESFSEGLSIVADRPLDVLSGVAQVGAEQLPTLGAAMVGTALTRNPNVGVGIMGASTFSQERFGQMQEVAQEMGYDISDPAQARAAIADEAFLDAQAERGFDRGLVIATIDALTLKAGSAFLPNNLKGLAGNTVLQMGSGAGGEALAQQVTLGEVAKPGEVLVEGLAEGPFAAAEVLGVMRNGGNSETRVDTPDPQAAAEEAILAQQAEQEQADNERAVRQSRVQAELDLMPFKDFQRLRNEDLTNRILDPNTEEGTDFRAWLAETRDENNPVPRTEADLRKAIGAYIKDAVPPVSFDEFNSVLDEHAAYRAEAAQRTPEAAAQAEQLRAELIAERAAARESGDAAAIAAVEAKAAEFFQPGEWRYYTLQADNRLPAAPKQGGLGANFTVQTTAPTQPTAPAQSDNAGLTANTSTDQPVNMVEPDAAAAPAAGEAPAVDTTPTPPVEAQTDAPTLADAPADAQSPELEATTDEAVNSVSPAQPTAGEAGTAPEADTTPPAKPEAPRTIEMRGFAQEQLGENWEVDFPDIQARFENRTGFYKKNANGEFAFQAAVRKAAEERAAEQQAEEAAFTPQNDEQRVNAEYAVRELGENWTQDEELTQILQDGKYGLFKREVDARAAEIERDAEERQGAGNMAAAFTNDPELRKTLSGQERRLYDELVDAFTNNRVDDVVTVDGAFNATAIAERLGFKGKQNVSTALARVRKKMAESKGISVKELSAQMAENAKANRQMQDDAEGDVSLAEQVGAYRDDSGLYVAPEGMSAVSAGGAQQLYEDGTTAISDNRASGRMTDAQKKARAKEIKEFRAAGMTDEQIRAFYAKQDEPENTDEVYQQKVEERRTATQQREDALIEQNFGALESMWNARRSEDGPDFADLSQENKRSWLGSVHEWAETNNDEQFDTDQRELEKITTKGAANGQAEQTNAGPVESGASVQQQRTADPQGPTGSGGQVDASAAQADSAGGTEDAGPVAYVNGQAVTGAAKPVVVTTKRRSIKKPATGAKKFSKRNPGGGTPITVDEIQQLAQEKYGATRYELDDGTEVATFPGGIYSRIQIHATPKEALRARGGKTGTMTMEDLKDAQAFIDPADPNVAHFIASNMDKETAAGVLDHEVGVHLGLEMQMDPIILGELTNAVKDWGTLAEGTLENDIYRAAMGRVAYARATGMDGSLTDIELLAYAVEEAVNAGVKPDANAKSVAARWLADVQDFFSKLLQRFINKDVLREMDPEIAQTEPVISAQELVALAQAAARVSTQDIVVEHGAHEDAKPDQVMGYYAAQDRGRPLADDASLEDIEYPGMEKFHWGKNSAFGPYNDITTDMTEGFGDGLFIDVNSSSVPDAWLTRLSLSPVAPNVYSVTVYGPMDDAVQGVSETKDVENEYWSRLEGVTHAQNIKLMTEARRRLTRYNGGIVPNLVWTRVTGAAAKNNTEDGRSGSLFYEDARKRFSKRDPGQKPQGEISIRNRAGRNWVKKNLGDATAQAYDSLASFVTDPIEKAQFLYDLVEGVQEKMPSLKNVYKALTKQEAVRNELIMEAESIAQRAAALKPERYAALNDFIGKSTFYQKWGYDPTQTHAELFKGRKIKVDPVMKAAWNRLTDVEQGIAADVFAQGEKRRVRMQEFMKKLGMKNNLFTAVSNLQGPYAPLKRFGNYVAVLKSEEVRNLERQIKDPKQATPRLKKKLDELKSSADHYVVQFFDTEGAANRFAEQNNVSNGGKYFRTEAFERTEQGDSDRAPSTQLLEELLGKLKADDKSGIDDASKEAFRTMLREHYFSMMDERDARTSGARRLNRAGYDTDMIKSFMFHSNAQAQMIASMEEGANINEALAQARQEAGEDRGNLMSAYNVVAQHYTNNMQRRGGFFDALNDKVTAFNSYHMLTTNVGYHVQNFTQIIVAANKLFGDFGNYSGAWTQLFKGLIAANKSLEGGGFLRQLGSVASAGIIDTKNNIEINLDSFSDEHKAVVRELQLHQLADVGMQEDLRQFTSFDTGFAPTNAIVDFGAKVAHRVYQAARYVEAHLRVATGIAAYEMAKQNPQVLRTLKVDSPIAYAVSSVQRTQGAFNGLDAPLYFKQLPKVVTQYRKYQLMMMSFYARSMNQAFLNESPEVREIGRRTLAVTMAHAAVTTGAVGSAFFMPLISPVISLIMAAFGGDDEEAIAAKAEAAGGYDKYMEQLIRERVEDEDLANLLTRGVPAFFGLDMSGKIGHQNTFTLTPFSDFEFTRDGIASYAGDLLLGPTMGTLRNFGAANEARLRGDEMTALKYVLPRGQRQMLESFDLANNGMRFSNQELLLDPRNIDIRSLALNALGLPPTEITTLKWTRSQQFEIRNYFDTRSSRLRDQYAEARRNNDRAAMSELREEWRELQRAKDRVRPFFNNQRGVLDRQPVTDLIRSSRTRERQAERNRRTLGTE